MSWLLRFGIWWRRSPAIALPDLVSYLPVVTDDGPAWLISVPISTLDQPLTVGSVVIGGRTFLVPQGCSKAGRLIFSTEVNVPSEEVLGDCLAIGETMEIVEGTRRLVVLDASGGISLLCITGVRELFHDQDECPRHSISTSTTKFLASEAVYESFGQIIADASRREDGEFGRVLTALIEEGVAALTAIDPSSHENEDENWWAHRMSDIGRFY